MDSVTDPDSAGVDRVDECAEAFVEVVGHMLLGREGSAFDVLADDPCFAPAADQPRNAWDLGKPLQRGGLTGREQPPDPTEGEQQETRLPLNLENDSAGGAFV